MSRCLFQGSFLGRLRHFVDVIDPRTLFVSEVNIATVRVIYLVGTGQKTSIEVDGGFHHTSNQVLLKQKVKRLPHLLFCLWRNQLIKKASRVHEHLYVGVRERTRCHTAAAFGCTRYTAAVTAYYLQGAVIQTQTMQCFA